MQHSLATIFQQVTTEPISTEIAHYVLSVVGLVLAGVIHRAGRRLREMEHTRVKAALSFNDLVERRPEMDKIYRAAVERNGV